MAPKQGTWPLPLGIGNHAWKATMFKWSTSAGYPVKKHTRNEAFQSKSPRFASQSSGTRL